MTLQPRERRALQMLPVGLLLTGISYYMTSDSTPTVVAPSVSTVAVAEKRLTRLREVAALVPGKQELLKKASADLAEREKSLIKADTAPQAQAQIVQILRRLGAAEAPPIEFKATELGGIAA